VNLFQYFDKIYTLCYGTSNFQTLIDALIQKEYTSKCKSRYSIIHLLFFLEFCSSIFKRIYTDVFRTQERWHITYYLLHSLWNYTDKTNAMCTVCIGRIKNIKILMFFCYRQLLMHKFFQCLCIISVRRIFLNIFRRMMFVYFHVLFIKKLRFFIFFVGNKKII
jgi:hypothetical protein